MKRQLLPHREQTPSTLTKSVNVVSGNNAVCSENPTKHMSTLYGENARFLSVAAGDPSSYHGL